MKTLKTILIILLIALIGMQFYRPQDNDAEVRDVASFEAETKPSPEIRTIMENTCYDCHSNKTVYPWYAEIAPVSYWIADHVDEGNEHFNASVWDTYDDKKKDHKLEELIEEVEEGEMPLNEYTWLHGGALNEEQRQAVIQWAEQARSNYKMGMSAE
ncbi:MAG: heme-binding domain-containing protein [Pricia sp.]